MSEKSHKDLINILSKLATEQVNPDTVDIDTLSPLEIVKKINAEDKKVPLVVEKALPEIAKAAQIAADTLKSGGRIVYIGAGTSGRLGVLDAAECPPTFGTDPSQVVGLISGGYDTLILSKEGAEDRTDWALDDLKRVKLSKDDFLIGIAASVRTPYTQTGLDYAIKLGCRTACIVCNNSDTLKIKPDVVITLPVGPEVITGSTRMKSGTAQKMTLNMITTTAMVLLGKTYGNLMVDLQARSEKLAARSRKILMEFLGIDYDEADALLKSSRGSVKTAIVMKKLSCNREQAEQKLKAADGFLKGVIPQERSTLGQIDDIFVDLYRQLDLRDKDGSWQSLHEVCKFKDDCWEKDWSRVPSGVSSHISRPWVGKNFHKSKLLVVGINMNEHGGYSAIENLFKKAKEEILIRRKLRFDSTDYKGTLVYHRMGSYAAIISNQLGLFNIEYDKDGFPSAEYISKAFDYIAFTNHIKCSPMGDFSKPSEKMWENCGTHILAKEMALMNPKIILILGMSANAWAFKQHLFKEIEWAKIGAIDKSVIFHSRVFFNNENINIFAVPHPSAFALNQQEIINNLKQGLGRIKSSQ